MPKRDRTRFVETARVQEKRPRRQRSAFALKSRRESCHSALGNMENIKINKKELIQKLILSLEEELLALKTAAQATYQAATHEESKPENEYDTFALEASYLAGAQAKRAGQIDEIIAKLS